MRVECSGTVSPAALGELERLLVRFPQAADLRFAYACMLDELGRADEARAAYAAVPQLDRGHFGARTNLGTLAFNAGDFGAARRHYAAAADIEPNAAAFTNLGTLHAALGDEPAARAAYDRALAIDAGFSTAHLGLAQLATLAGDAAAAAAHERAAFATPIVRATPYRGSGTPLRVLLLLAGNGGNLVHTLLFDDRHVALTTLVAESARPDDLPAHDLIVNGIADADRSAGALDAAARIIAAAGSPAINDPSIVRQTGRVAMAERLGAVDGAITARTLRLDRRAMTAATLIERGFTFPLLLRASGYHAGQHFERVATAHDLAATLAALPGDDLFAIEQLDTQSADGAFRKYRVLFVDGAIYPVHLAIADAWKVHYFSAGMERSDERRSEEARFLHDLPAALGPAVMATLARIRDELALDYGGVDFALDARGRVAVFEANASMALYYPAGDGRFDYRRPAVERITAAVAAMLGARARPA